MEIIQDMLCPEQNCFGFVHMHYTTSFTPQAFIFSFNVILQLIFLFSLVRKRKDPIPTLPEQCPRLDILSTILVACLGLTYLGLGIWMLEENMTKSKTALPLYWLVLLFQGFTWLFVSFTMSLWGKNLSKFFVTLESILASIYAGIMSGFAIMVIIANKKASVRNVLDILTFPSAIMFLFHAHKIYGAEESRESVNGMSLYTPLNGEAHGSTDINSSSNITLLARAGFFSRMTFWWLNPLMKEGKERPLGDEDVPHLRDEDCAKSSYTLFLQQLNIQRQRSPSTPPSVLWAIIVCQWKGITISGCFALLKILTLSCGPLLLNPFIEVAEGNSAFKYEGYVLALLLFVTKCLESLSQRQWYFQIRVVGLRIRSLLSAAIYRKQMRLSNSSMLLHSSGQIMNYVTVDAYRIGEFPYWFHQAWTTSLQLCIALCILFHVVGLATIVTLVAIIVAVFCNTPLAKLQHKFQTELMRVQDARLKAIARALMNMRVLKLYAWEAHFMHVIEKLRGEECKWLRGLQLQKAYSGFLFCSSPVLVSAATFGACYFLGIPLNAGNVFTFVATLRLLQVPVRAVPDVIGMVIQAKVALERIITFLEAPELPTGTVGQARNMEELKHSIFITCADFSWEENPSIPTLKNINIAVTPGEKVAICGEIGSGKSTLLAAICGEVSNINGTIQVHGKIAYVSQTAWIYTGTIQENILFGSRFEEHKYQQTLEKCSLVKDIEMLPFGDLTEIGERGINLSGAQKQRIQLARALYQDADIYLLDDPFSAVDAHTATRLFNEYVMDALSGKTVLLVTHQVNFLPACDSVLLISDGKIVHASSYHQLLASSQEFQALVNAQKNTVGSEKQANIVSVQKTTTRMIEKASADKQCPSSSGDQMIKTEERETGDTGLKAYSLYLCHGNGYLYFSLACLVHLTFAIGQILQNSWMAANVHNPSISELRLIIVYLIIGIVSTFFFFARYLLVVAISMQSSKSLFLKLLNSVFHAPMSFYDATPLGRILSRVSSDLSIMDLDVPLSFSLSIGSTINTYANLIVLAVVTWPVFFVSIPMVLLIMRLQRYYLASAKELMRINGTTKSMLANHLSETIGGAMTIRAFHKEDQFFAQNLNLIDINASSFFHNFAAKEWLIQRLEILSSTVISSSALAMVLLPTGTFSAGFAGMALSYGLSLNISLVNSTQNQCTLANHIVSVERLNQYMNIPTEAPEILDENRPTPSWPSVGRVEIQDLKIRYRPATPLVLQGISCTFEGGHKIGIVGRTGSGKTTLISALFRLVEPVEGKIIIDELDISTIGTRDLRSRFGIIPQDPTLFTGTVRYNLDPLSQHNDVEIWEVIKNCQLQELVRDKEEGLYASVVEDGTNWSMGQRQLFCLGRALLRKSRILVLDEATASIDNVTDTIIQRIIRRECLDCTVITVAHRISSIMDYTMVLSISEGKLMEYDEPMKLINREGSLFGQLAKEYWSNSELN